MKRHPQLAKKFELLYSLRLNPTIKSHSDLAEVLGISRQAVGRWARGTETSQGDAIPLAQLESVAAIFGINDHWFSLEYDAFESAIFNKREEQGFVDNNVLEKISVSLLPVTPAKIFGRKSELKVLDEEWRNSKTNVIQLLGFGGMGKSSLINAWLSRLDQKGYCGAKRVYAWSFHWQAAGSEVRSSGDYFVEHALSWFGDEDPTAGTPWAKATRLAVLIRKERTLLILDGLEPMQFPPGPKQGQVENPAVALLIKELATDMNGLCVITSRLHASDLGAYEGTRVQSMELNRLSEKACIKLLKSLGIQGSHDGYVKAIADYSGHPLSLSLLGGYLNVVHRSQIGEYSRIRSLLEEQSLGEQATNLMQSYLDWFQGTIESSMLFLVGLFDRAISIRSIQEVISQNPCIIGLTENLDGITQLQLSYAIDRLKKSNLISVTEIASELVLDCHPLVRDFIAEYLKDKEPVVLQQGHEVIFRYLQNEAVDNPENMADLEPLFRAVIHGTQAGLFMEAFELYFEKIKRKQFSMFTKGSHHADQACIRAFFDEEWKNPVQDLSEDAKYYLLSSTCTNLIYLGEADAAVEPALRAIEYFTSKGMWLEALNTGGPLVSMMMISGKLRLAIELMSELGEVIQKSENKVIAAMSKSFEAHALHLSGRDADAKKLFEESETVLTSSDPGESVSFPTISSYYCKFLLETGDIKSALERSLKTFAWRRKNSWQVAIDTTSLLASDMQVLGLIFLANGDRINAKIYLDKQVSLLKDADEWLYLPSGLNSRARFYLAIGDYLSAEADLKLSLQISTKTGARLNEWETCLNLANLALYEDDPKRAKEWLNQMSMIPDMSQYRFRDREITDLQKEIVAREKKETDKSVKPAAP